MANLSNINNKFLVTTGGDVGIGATGPASRLEIAMNDAAGNRLGFTGDGSTSGSALWTNWITGASYLDFRLGGTTDTYTKMRITETGNVGIGTTSPNFKLDIVNAAANTATYQQFRNGTTGTASSDGTVLGIDADGDFLINNQEAKEIKLYTSDTPRLIIQSGGNVGIGGSPSAWALGKTIQINGSYGTINYNGISAILGIINAYYNGSAYIRQNVGYAGSIDFNTAISGGGFAFRTENTTGSAGDTVTLSTKMAITSAGNVGIGTTTANSKLEIYSTATFDPRTSGINIHRPGSFGQYGSIAYNVNETVISSTYTGTGATDYGGIKFQQFNNGTVPRVVMFLNTVGNVGIGTVTPSTKLEIFGNNSTRNTLQNILAINGGENVSNPYDGFGAGLVFRGRDYSNALRDYTYIYGVIENQTSSTTPAGDPGFKSQLRFYTNTGGASATLPTQKMVITSAGNVGIGTISPDTLLQATNTADGTDYISYEIGNGAVNANNKGGFAIYELGVKQATLEYYRDGSGRFEIASQGASNHISFATTPTGGTIAERMRIKSDGNILIADTRQIQFYNTDQYIRASSTNDLEVVAGDDINYRSNFSRFFSGSAEHARLTGIGGTSWVVNGSATHLFGVGLTNPSTKLTVKDSQDSSLYSGLKVERSANTTGAYLNAVGGALNLNTDSSMPLKFRIQNSSMQTINTDGGRAYAANASGLNMKEYGYNFTAANGVTVDLIENTNAYSDIAMVQISIAAYHSSRTFFAGMGTFGGYGFHLTGGGNGLGNGGLTSTSTGAGFRKLQWSNTSGYNAVVRLYIQIRTESGITVLNGTLSSL